MRDGYPNNDCQLQSDLGVLPYLHIIVGVTDQLNGVAALDGDPHT